MSFPSNITGFTESDVREEIIAPLLRSLGYQAGSPANIIREQSLRYPRISLGRKKPGKDPLLRGRADYICDASGVRWTIEAKPTTQQLDPDVVEQAFTYANHPEVRAVMFVVSNGVKMDIYQTDRGPDVPPILSVAYADLEAREQVLRNLLSPDSLHHTYPRIEPDVSEPLGVGLRSIVRIINGEIHFRRLDPPTPALEDIILAVTEGSIERDEQKRLTAFLRIKSHTHAIETLNHRLGIDTMELTSDATHLPVNPAEPVRFSSTTHVLLAAGESLPLPGTGQSLRLPMNLECTVVTEANGHLAGSTISGEFNAHYTYTRPVPSVSAYGVFKMAVG
ncbi:MAG: hypothetical protein ACKVXR_15580 [Planctomycetota bacterium]